MELEKKPKRIRLYTSLKHFYLFTRLLKMLRVASLSLGRQYCEKNKQNESLRHGAYAFYVVYKLIFFAREFCFHLVTTFPTHSSLLPIEPLPASSYVQGVLYAAHGLLRKEITVIKNLIAESQQKKDFVTAERLTVCLKSHIVMANIVLAKLNNLENQVYQVIAEGPEKTILTYEFLNSFFHDFHV